MHGAHDACVGPPEGAVGVNAVEDAVAKGVGLDVGPCGVKRGPEPLRQGGPGGTVIIGALRTVRTPGAGGEMAIDPISAAPWGSASILTIAWAYIKMLGWSGLKKSTETSLLAANYVAHRLKDHYKLKYTGDRGRVAHELLIDGQWQRREGAGD